MIASLTLYRNRTLLQKNWFRGRDRRGARGGNMLGTPTPTRRLAVTKRVEIRGDTSDESLPHHLQVQSLHAIAPRHPLPSLTHRCMVVQRDAHCLPTPPLPLPTRHVIPASPLRSTRTPRSPKSQRHITNTLRGPETDTSTAVLVCATTRPIVRDTTAQGPKGQEA